MDATRGGKASSLKSWPWLRHKPTTASNSQPPDLRGQHPGKSGSQAILIERGPMTAFLVGLLIGAGGILFGVSTYLVKSWLNSAWHPWWARLMRWPLRPRP
jgi:hypothetical protein